MNAIRNKKIIFDSNIWISFIIGRKLPELIDIIKNHQIKVLSCQILINEIRDVLNRPKFRKYISSDDIEEAIIIHRKLVSEYNNLIIKPLCRDNHDDYLFALAYAQNADFIVSGDNDVLDVQIIPPPKLISLRSFFDTANSLA